MLPEEWPGFDITYRYRSSVYQITVQKDASIGATTISVDGEAQTALIAADVALVASGTASLECALCKRPMVVVYRLGVLSAWVLRRLNLVKARFFAQPNLLADRRVVGEYFHEQIVPGSIGAELLAWLDDAPRRAALEEEFTAIHRQLRQGGSAAAAAAILTLAGAARA